MGRMVTNPATRKMPLFPILSDKGRPGRYEDCLAAFQRLHSPPLHAEAVRRARECLFRRRPRHSGTAASKTDDGCPHL